MRITTIRYRRLQSHERGYGHDAVEAEAQIDEDEDAESALAELKVWVLERLDGIRKISEHCETLQRLQERVTSEERRLERLQNEVKLNRQIINQHAKLADLARTNGLDTEADSLDQVPF
jgi:hypothetical protein